MNSQTQLKTLKTTRTGKFLPIAALGIAGTLYAVNLNRRRKTAASSHSRMLKNIEQDAKQIKLEWKGPRRPYRVFRGEELIYEGLEPKLVDQNLVPGTLYTYCIEALDDHGNVEVKMRIQTTTSVDLKERDNILEDLLITTIVTHGQIGFEWEPIEGVSEYSIFRNGIKLETVTSCAFTDKNINDDDDYNYTIKARRPLQRSDKIKWELKSVVANAVGAIKKDSSTEMAADEEFTITKRIGPLKDLLKSPQESKHKSGNWQLRYTTFLKEEWLKNPNAASEDQIFKGDHRTFDPESSEFRTRSDVFIDTDNPSALLSKATGNTEAFTKKHEQLESASASDEGIQLEKVLTEDDRVQFHLNHSVSNPLVVSPAIDYHVCGTFYKDNEFDLVGIHDQAPEHEIYLKEPGTDEWQVIHQAHSKGLEMMADPMANHYWRYSTFTN
ncbi:DUF3238 domain-containing protein [Mesobacillus selenatarsenatis]|uniref:DUF3238 domain-containing protein n=1 Tax=Mesobacillus selenatarsenatis (strain DSM 18680 / JCM 14380 / FERM P-15431 / SF-1) TaxID=1321606 RepID=A0A0A8X456_MESS1|nr:DUF3238 domain-containing protein [Mesobacillus selenatarsenatis]GAM14728.1 hypothetical protein SAMD00020551_2881 [Mesobacillus selenatarsenatis SF-1]